MRLINHTLISEQRSIRKTNDGQETKLIVYDNYLGLYWPFITNLYCATLWNYTFRAFIVILLTDFLTPSEGFSQRPSSLKLWKFYLNLAAYTITTVTVTRNSLINPSNLYKYKKTQIKTVLRSILVQCTHLNYYS